MSYKQMLQCTEQAINAFGELRAAGVERDAWPEILHEANRAIWKAHNAIEALTKAREQKLQDNITAFHAGPHSQRGIPPFQR